MPSGYKIRWLTTTSKNLDDEAVYIAQDDPLAAVALVKHVVDMVDALAEYPAIGRPGRIPGTRELIITGHALPHTVSGERQGR